MAGRFPPRGWGAPGRRAERNQGRPRPRRMSKMLEPRALDTAMSPFPCRATGGRGGVEGGGRACLAGMG